MKDFIKHIIKENATVLDAISQLESISLSNLTLFVCDSNNKLVGTITDGDIRRILRLEKEKALRLKAKDFYSKNPIVITSEKKIFEAEALMQEKKISALVVAEENVLLGILHRYDI